MESYNARDESIEFKCEINITRAVRHIANVPYKTEVEQTEEVARNQCENGHLDYTKQAKSNNQNRNTVSLNTLHVKYTSYS